jgi:hypothetical protein
VLWGLYHGVLLVTTRLIGPWLPEAGRPWRPIVSALQVVTMFVLVNIGWLMFRETDSAMLAADFLRSPWTSTPLERQIGLYLLTLTAAYSLPLWMHAWWEEGRQPESAAEATTGHPAWALVQAGVFGVLFALLLVFRSRTSLDFIYFHF